MHEGTPPRPTPDRAAPAAPTPAPPFDRWPVQLFDPGVGFAWYCEPAALVIQTVVPRGSFDAVERMNDIIDRVLDARGTQIRAVGGLLLLHDWRTLKGYDKDARDRQFERMQSRPAGYARRTVIVVAPANRLLRMAVETAGLFATITLGSRVELATTPGGALSRHGIQAPDERAGSFRV